MLNGNILTELQTKEKTSGLYIPDNKTYKVLKVIKSEIKEVENGALIYVPKTAGTNIEMGEDKYVVVNIREIILIVWD